MRWRRKRIRVAMASALSFSLHPPLLSNNSLPLLPSLPPSPPLSSQLSAALASSRKLPVLRLQSGVPRASAEGVPIGLVEDSKFVPLNAEDPRYGPPALLLVGFDTEEAGKIQQLLKEMDGEFLQIVYCTESMVNRSLWEAVHTRQPDLKAIKIAKNVPRICFLSGLSGEEMMMFIDAFPETGLEPAVFAALVPNSANKPVQELIEEIMGDHEMLTGKQ